MPSNLIRRLIKKLRPAPDARVDEAEIRTDATIKRTDELNRQRRELLDAYSRSYRGGRKQ